MEAYSRGNHQPYTQCYFCGEEIPTNELELHVKHCGLVLEPCPDNCGLYVQRQYKTHHANWCKKDPRHYTQTLETQLRKVKSELESVHLSIESERNLRLQLQADWAYQFSKCCQRFQKAEELNNKVVTALNGIKNLMAEDRQARSRDFNEVKTNLANVCKIVSQLKFTITQTKLEVEEIKNNSNDLEQRKELQIFINNFEMWRQKYENVITSLKETLDKDIHAEINRLHKDNVTRSKSVNDLLDLNEIIIDSQDKYSEQIKIWEEDIARFKKFLTEENIMISGVWYEQLQDVKKLKSQFDTMADIVKELAEEQVLIRERLDMLEKTVSNVSNKYNEAQDISENENTLKELLDDITQVKKRLEHLENLSEEKNNTHSTEKCNGVLVTNIEQNFVKELDSITKRLEHLENSSQKEKVPVITKCHLSKQNDVLDDLTSEHLVFRKRLERLESFVETQRSGSTSDYEKVVKEVKTKEKPKSTSAPASTNGRLIWAISNFTERMRMSKESNMVLNSPVFYSSEFGYKLQLRAYLNGIGQWKGRHMIVSLHVLPSEWDSLLQWPCRLQVTICLRDQVPIQRKAKDIIKCFSSSAVDRDSDHKGLQMFIPHRTLAEHSYLKDDIVILEVKVVSK